MSVQYAHYTDDVPPTTAATAALEVRDILADDKAVPGPSSDDFWVMVAALKAFVVS